MRILIRAYAQINFLRVIARYFHVNLRRTYRTTLSSKFAVIGSIRHFRMNGRDAIFAGSAIQFVAEYIIATCIGVHRVDAFKTAHSGNDADRNIGNRFVGGAIHNAARNCHCAIFSIHRCRLHICYYGEVGRIA